MERSGKDRPLAGRTALVTGAARRIGREIALTLARAGADIVVHHLRSVSEAEETAAAVQAFGVEAWLLAADLADPDAAEDIVSRAWALSGGFDILVNNASVFPADTVPDLTAAVLHEILDLNAIAPLMLSRAFAARTDTGSIVNLLDTRIAAVDTAHAAYHLSKQLLAAVTDLTAAAFAPGIRVNGVAPGVILAPVGDPAARLPSGRTLVGGSGSPADVADAVLFLVSHPFMTGEVIFVDGGQRIKARMVGRGAMDE